jgi:V8-like Glu-specific endopeptidase
VLAYWTPARIRAAIPRERVLDPGKAPLPAAKPGGGGTSGAVTGASWNGGGKMLKATGRALFTMDGTDYICSGSIVNDTSSGRSVVLTAGHCVVENDGTFATNWIFIPSFDTSPTYTCARTTYGCWVADALYADALFASAGSFNNQAVTHDWAFAVVSAGGLNGTSQLDDPLRGSFPIQYGVSKGTTLSAFGYPAAGKYRGSDLVYCKGAIGTDPNMSDATWSMSCDMTGGSSGGPWVQASAADYGDAILSGLNSYGYSGVKNMYSPKFTLGTKAVFDAADAKAANASGVAIKTFR